MQELPVLRNNAYLSMVRLKRSLYVAGGYPLRANLLVTGLTCGSVCSQRQLILAHVFA